MIFPMGKIEQVHYLWGTKSVMVCWERKRAVVIGLQPTLGNLQPIVRNML